MKNVVPIGGIPKKQAKGLYLLEKLCVNNKQRADYCAPLPRQGVKKRE